MADEITTVDDIVTQHAAKAKENLGGENQEKVIEKVDPAGDTGKKYEPVKPPGDTTPPPVINPYGDLLKELGVDSVEALKEKLKPKEDKPESPEEKEKRENLYRVNLQKYAVEEGVMKPEDFTKLENLKAKDDKTLVYENWLSSWKEENPDIDPAEAERISKEEFDAEYKLNSENEKAKARGLAKITKEAAEMRTPLEKAYSKAKTNFDEARSVADNYPDFQKKISGFIQENVPEKYDVFKVKDGEEEVPIPVDLTPEDRREIFQAVAKELLNADNYDLYVKKDFKALQELAKTKAQALILGKYREVGAQKIAEVFLSRGTKKGSTTGAKNPFPLSGDGKVNPDKGTLSPKEEVLNQPAFQA